MNIQNYMPSTGRMLKEDDSIVNIANLIEKGVLVTGTQVGADQRVTWANSDPANTQKVITIIKPAQVIKTHSITVYNPSTVTDLTVKVLNTKAVNGTSRDCLVTSFVVPKSQSVTGTTVNTYSVEVEGMFVGGNVKLAVSNNTVLGVADTFSADIRVDEVI